MANEIFLLSHACIFPCIMLWFTWVTCYVCPRRIFHWQVGLDNFCCPMHLFYTCCGSMQRPPPGLYLFCLPKAGSFALKELPGFLPHRGTYRIKLPLALAAVSILTILLFALCVIVILTWADRRIESPLRLPGTPSVG